MAQQMSTIHNSYNRYGLLLRWYTSSWKERCSITDFQNRDQEINRGNIVKHWVGGSGCNQVSRFFCGMMQVLMRPKTQKAWLLTAGKLLFLDWSGSENQRSRAQEASTHTALLPSRGQLDFLASTRRTDKRSVRNCCHVGCVVLPNHFIWTIASKERWEVFVLSGYVWHQTPGLDPERGVQLRHSNRFSRDWENLN